MVLFAWFSLQLLVTACSTPKEQSSATNCEMPWRDVSLGEAIDLEGQGISADEEVKARALAADLLTDPNIVFVAWRDLESNRYLLIDKNGEYSFWRGADAIHWDVEPPVSRKTDIALTLSDELALGTNPNNVDLDGYQSDDVRISFPNATQTSWPNLGERIAQIFDHANSPDLIYITESFARGGRGSHGGMSLTQSRAPLIIRGPGIKPGTVAEAAKLVDIAPTVAALLGVEPINGIHGSTHHQAENLYLKWQDGGVLGAVENCSHGSATYAAIIILDGVNMTELYDGMLRGDLKNIARIGDEKGAIWEQGAISGWPSFSLPGHLSIFTGAYQGRHGLLSNTFWNREAQAFESTSLIDLLTPGNHEMANAYFDKYLSPNVETLFEAVERSFTDVVTASVNELTQRGADWTTAAQTGESSRNLFNYQAADALAVMQVQQLFEERPPKLLGINFALTDGAGEADGPHGNLLREKLIETDNRIGVVLDLYEQAGIFEETVFVITADHGMALQDPSRTAAVNSILNQHGAVAAQHLVSFPTQSVE